MMRPLLTVVVLLLLFSPGGGAVLVRRSLSDFPGAVCLDGSPAAVYHSPLPTHPDTPPSSHHYQPQPPTVNELEMEDNNIQKLDTKSASVSPSAGLLVYLHGGGYCPGAAECELRCRIAPSLCTAAWEPSVLGRGVLSDDPAENPVFHAFHRVSVPYCSGDMYIGRRGASAATHGFHFRGRHIIAAVISWLKSAAPDVTSGHVVLAGSSAGGAGVAFNCNLLQRLLPNARVSCVVDSAFFYPHVAPFTNRSTCASIDRVLQSGAQLWGAPEAATLELQRWWLHVQPPVFISSAKFDRFGMESYCGLTTDPRHRAIWGRGVEALQRRLANTAAANVGWFIPGCVHHTMLVDREALTELPVGPSGLTFSQLLANWLAGHGPTRATDTCQNAPDSCNSRCHFVDRIFTD